jgi:glycosyltransferase involved in cell wall biosynthesis
MRIILDMRYRTRSGAATYIDSIVPGLVRLGRGHEFIVLREEEQSLPPGTECESITERHHSALGQALHDQLALPRLLRSLGADIYHPLKHLGTLFPPCHQITVGHSITRPYRGVFPVSRSEAIYWQFFGNKMFQRSTAVIAVSEFVRDFLIEVIDVPPERITVIHHGTDPRFRRLTAPGEASVSRGSPYLLTVGNIFPVKNFVTAVEVLGRLAPDAPDLRLKMAGSTRHPYCEVVRSRARDLGVLDRVDFLGFQSPEALVELMNGALVLLVPSLTEGFALTLLEALACGTPAVASARGAIPEVGGEAVCLVEDPDDIPAWTAATRDLVADASRRAVLSRQALERSTRFTWQASVEQTLGVYQSLA